MHDSEVDESIWNLRYLEKVRQKIARGETLIVKQVERLTQLRKDGHPTTEAERTLDNLKGIVQALRGMQEIIERTLRNIELRKQ